MHKNQRITKRFMTYGGVWLTMTTCRYGCSLFTVAFFVSLAFKSAGIALKFPLNVTSVGQWMERISLEQLSCAWKPVARAQSEMSKGLGIEWFKISESVTRGIVTDNHTGCYIS